MPATYEPIATTTLTGNSASIDFNSIPTTYTDLRLIFTGISGTQNGMPIGIRFNGDTANNFSNNTFYGNAVNSYLETNTNRINLLSLVSVAGLDNQRLATWQIDINSYRTAMWKTAMWKAGQSYWNVVFLGVGTWRSTDPITSISIMTIGSDAYGATTTATLFGILRA